MDSKSFFFAILYNAETWPMWKIYSSVTALIIIIIIPKRSWNHSAGKVTGYRLFDT
jgi:hypothetical protein